MPSDQQAPTMSGSRTNGWCSSTALRSVAADQGTYASSECEAAMRDRAIVVPKDARAPCSKSVSAESRLYFVLSRQTNVGGSSRIMDRGSRPSFRAREKRSSLRAEADASASSSHHSGQAAFIADWEKPEARNAVFSSFPVFGNCESAPGSLRPKLPERADDVNHSIGVFVGVVPYSTERSDDAIRSRISSVHDFCITE